MHPITHFLIGWAAANTAALDRRDRMMVTGAAVIADLDGLGAIPELLTLPSDPSLPWYSGYHHMLTHNVGVALMVAMITLWFARRRFLTPLLASLGFHLHLLGDLMGSRGPDGYQWPIPYFLPFSDARQLTWNGQWQLNAWPNITLTILLLTLTFYWAWRRGYSPMEMFSPSADRALVAALRKNFGPSKSLGNASSEASRERDREAVKLRKIS